MQNPCYRSLITYFEIDVIVEIVGILYQYLIEVTLYAPVITRMLRHRQCMIKLIMDAQTLSRV